LKVLSQLFFKLAQSFLVQAVLLIERIACCLYGFNSRFGNQAQPVPYYGLVLAPTAADQLSLMALVVGALRQVDLNLCHPFGPKFNLLAVRPEDAACALRFVCF
jgi:hypothetical protein